MPSTIKRSSPRSASVRASRLSGEGSTAGCSGSLLSRAALTSHKLMELRTPVRCLRTRGQLDELLPPFLSPSPSTLTFPSDSVSTALAPAVECARPHVWGGTGRPIACGSTCSHAAMEVCSSQMVGASRFSVEALFPRFEGAVNAYARRERGTLGPPSMSLQATARNPTESVRTLCIHTGRRVGYRAAFGSRELGYHAHIRPLDCPPPTRSAGGSTLSKMSVIIANWFKPPTGEDQTAEGADTSSSTRADTGGASSSSSVHVDGWRTRKSSREDGMAPRHTWPAPTPTRHTPGLLHRSGGLPSQFITVRA